MWQGQGRPRAEEWHVEALTGQREGQESEERRKRTRREIGAAYLESVQLLAAGATGVAGDEAGAARRICFHHDRKQDDGFQHGKDVRPSLFFSTGPTRVASV